MYEATFTCSVLHVGKIMEKEENNASKKIRYVREAALIKKKSDVI
jgi:hypothetical protein